MERSVASSLSRLDRYLPLWIFLAMAIGVGLGKLAPSIGPSLDKVKFADVSVPIGIGLLWMMYPVLARVRYEKLGRFSTRGKVFTTSLLLNWVLGPILMFLLAWFLLPDLPHYRNGLIMVGLARCIAMVLIWNMLARGDNEMAAILVALNSLFQIFFYSVLGYLFLTVVPGWFGGEGTAVQISMWQIARNVLIFLGIPLAAGAITRMILIRAKGHEWYDTRFMPRLGPTALVGLLYTIVVLFSIQGQNIVELPLDVIRIAIPLTLYFFIMFGLAFFISRGLGFRYRETTSISFTAASNNFELAIAVVIGVFGISSREALATVVGPLVEVPVLVGLVYVALWARERYFPGEEMEPVAPATEKQSETSQVAQHED